MANLNEKKKTKRVDYSFVKATTDNDDDDDNDDEVEYNYNMNKTELDGNQDYDSTSIVTVLNQKKHRSTSRKRFILLVACVGLTAILLLMVAAAAANKSPIILRRSKVNNKSNTDGDSDESKGNKLVAGSDSSITGKKEQKRDEDPIITAYCGGGDSSTTFCPLAIFRQQQSSAGAGAVIMPPSPPSEEEDFTTTSTTSNDSSLSSSSSNRLVGSPLQSPQLSHTDLTIASRKTISLFGLDVQLSSDGSILAVLDSGLGMSHNGSISLYGYNNNTSSYQLLGQVIQDPRTYTKDWDKETTFATSMSMARNTKRLAIGSLVDERNYTGMIQFLDYYNHRDREGGDGDDDDDDDQILPPQWVPRESLLVRCRYGHEIHLSDDGNVLVTTSKYGMDVYEYIINHGSWKQRGESLVMAKLQSNQILFGGHPRISGDGLLVGYPRLHNNNVTSSLATIFKWNHDTNDGETQEGAWEQLSFDNSKRTRHITKVDLVEFNHDGSILAVVGKKVDPSSRWGSLIPVVQTYRYNPTTKQYEVYGNDQYPVILENAIHDDNSGISRDNMVNSIDVSSDGTQLVVSTSVFPSLDGRGRVSIFQMMAATQEWQLKSSIISGQPDFIVNVISSVKFGGGGKDGDSLIAVAASSVVDPKNDETKYFELPGFAAVYTNT